MSEAGVEVGVHVRTVGFTRLDWIARGFDSLVDCARPGAPRKITDSQLEKIVEAASAEPLTAKSLLARHIKTGGKAVYVNTLIGVLKMKGFVWKRTRHSKKEEMRKSLGLLRSALGRMNKYLVAIATALVGCSSGSPQISVEIARQFAKGESVEIDLKHFGPPSWQKICVLTPYSTNQQAKQVLGFEWDAEGKTGIASSDSVNVLVFVRAAEVLAFTEHPRNMGDFSELEPSCLPRADSKLIRRSDSNGWVYLVAKNAA